MIGNVFRSGLTFVCATLVAIGGAKSPNILWISCEDTSPDLGCYGAKGALTPNLDALAADGVRFTRAFSTAPVCAPSRSSIITGRFASSIGTHHMRSEAIPPVGVKCFTEYLRAAGYYCTNNWKTDYNFDPPLAAWDENSKQAHWRKRPEGSPFFAVFNLTTTHESKSHMNEQKFEREVGKDVPPGSRHNPAEVDLPPYYPDTPVIRKAWARYQDTISAMDAQAGEILSQLEKDGLKDETIVFFFSDHGRGMPRAKRTLGDAGTRVPLIVRIPGGQGKQVREDLVSLIDLPSTILSLAGVSAPEGLQGRVIIGEKMAMAPENLFFIRDRVDEKLDFARSVRDKQFRYVRNFLPELPATQRTNFERRSPILKELIRLHDDKQLTGAQALYMQPRRPKEELYDTVADPHEINNLAEVLGQQERLAKMRATLDEWMKKTGDMGHIPEAKLQKEWFPNGKKPETQKPALSTFTDANAETVTVTMTCATPGATIVWSTAEPTSRWQIYQRPVAIAADKGTSVTVRARASRAGYEDSTAAIVEF